MTAEIEMKARAAGRAKVAAMSMAHRAAVVADDAIAKDGMTVAIMAGDDAFAIHRCAAGAAVVCKAAAGVMAVKGLRTGRSKDSKAGGDSEERDDLFHDEGRFAFEL